MQFLSEGYKMLNVIGSDKNIIHVNQYKEKLIVLI